jgi:hypothetical protein
MVEERKISEPEKEKATKNKKIPSPVEKLNTGDKADMLYLARNKFINN